MRPIGDWSIWMILSTWSRPQHRGVRARPLPRAVQLVGHRLEQDLVDQRRLARARHAGDARHDAERHLDVDLLEVVLRRAADLDEARRRAPAGRHVDRARARQELAGERRLDPLDLRGRALRPRRGRRARRRRGPCRSGGRPRASSARRARRPAPCCRGRAGARACRSAWSCRAGAGRSTARRGRTARRPAPSRSASPGGSAAPRRPTAWPPRGPSTGSRCRRSPGTAAARGSRGR